MNIYIGSDHGGEDLRYEIDQYLQSLGHNVYDMSGTNSGDDDYPDFAHEVSQKVSSDENSLGILICTSGTGMCITANKHRGIRAAKITEPNEAYFGRLHNNINVMCLAGMKLPPIANGKPLYEKATQVTTLDDIKESLDIFLNTNFEKGGRHERRTDKIELN